MSLQFSVGDLTIHRIIEQETTFLPALDLLPALTPGVLSENRAWMQRAGALDADDVLILCFQSYVVKTPHHTILVDSCIGNDKPRPLRPKWNMKTDDTYITGLAAAGVSVADIDVVMCTHLHVDHVGWNTRLQNGRWVPTFPNARYIFAKGEFDYWTAQNGKAEVPPFADSVLPVVAANKAEIVTHDFAIGDHVRILPTPGHTPGHVAFTFGKGKDDAVFSGDLMHSPLQTRHPELSAKFDVDQTQAAGKKWDCGQEGGDEGDKEELAGAEEVAVAESEDNEAEASGFQPPNEHGFENEGGKTGQGGDGAKAEVFVVMEYGFREQAQEALTPPGAHGKNDCDPG